MAVDIEEVAAPIKRINSYEEFQKSEGLPSIRGFAVDDLNTVELGPWTRKGGRGVYINLDGTGGLNDAYVCEIPPGGGLNPEHFLFEETIYILSGHGSTSVWYDEERKVSFEWKAGSVFAIPLNAWHRHFNARGSAPARFLSVTDAPLIMNLFHNLDFIFDTPAVFDDRFAGQDSYFNSNGKLYASNILETNFISDSRALPLYTNTRRGMGKGVRLELSHNTTHAHVAEFPVGTYKKAHRHGPGAHVVMLGGKGYSVLWPAGAEPTRFDWRAGSMFVPPNNWFHQHFNAGAEPARYLALRWGSARYDMGGAITGWTTGHSYDIEGAQIEYENEDPAIHTMFEAELASARARCRMRGRIPWCSGDEM
jgi:oxalate decarboxylase/phosphoglucose isomerase-like protein (cupin superfamily)